MARAVLRMLPGGRLPPLDLQTLVALAQEWGPVVQELLPGIAVTGEMLGQPTSWFVRARDDAEHPPPCLCHTWQLCWVERLCIMPAAKAGCWGLQHCAGCCSTPHSAVELLNLRCKASRHLVCFSACV